jgi:CheY-like chemotaxis protein
MNLIDSGIAQAIDRPLSVLFVEDEFDRCVDYLTAVLSRGWHAQVMSSAETALAAAESDPPDAIVMEVGRGAFDGFALAHRVKSGVSTHHLPVIALTDSPMEEVLAAAMVARCSGVVTRSHDVDALIAAVKGAVVVADILACRRAARAMTNPGPVGASRRFMEPPWAALQSVG